MPKPQEGFRHLVPRAQARYMGAAGTEEVVGTDVLQPDWFVSAVGIILSSIVFNNGVLCKNEALLRLFFFADFAEQVPRLQLQDLLEMPVRGGNVQRNLRHLYSVRCPAPESPISTLPAGKYSRHRCVTLAEVSSSANSSLGYQGFIRASITIGAA